MKASEKISNEYIRMKLDKLMLVLTRFSLNKTIAARLQKFQLLETLDRRKRINLERKKENIKEEINKLISITTLENHNKLKQLLNKVKKSF